MSASIEKSISDDGQQHGGGDIDAYNQKEAA